MDRDDNGMDSAVKRGGETAINDQQANQIASEGLHETSPWWHTMWAGA